MTNETTIKEKTATTTLRGVVRRYSDQSFDFTPYGKGEPVYDEQHKYKNGVTIAKTRGQQARRVVRIPIGADAPDVYEACLQKLNEALPEAAGAQHAAPLRRRAVVLQAEGVQAVYDRKTQRLHVQLEVAAAPLPKMTKTLFNHFNQLNLCLATSKITSVPA